jgi:hypothetical protein
MKSFIHILLVFILYGCSQPETQIIESSNTYGFEERDTTNNFERELALMIKDDSTFDEVVKEEFLTGQVQAVVKKKVIKTSITKAHTAPDHNTPFIAVYDSIKYNEITVNYFTSISAALGGVPHFAENASDIDEVIMNILDSELDNVTDIVLLIDKTGSMDDDWDVVQNSLKNIYNYIEKFENVRLGIASYGDKNYHGDIWYHKVNLDADLTKLESFMTTYSTIGNPDTRESVNDAIVKTVNEMDWEMGSNRLLLVIGDAPSQIGSLSDYSNEEVINECLLADVKFNLFPIIISSSNVEFNDTPKSTSFAKVFPNPAKEYFNIQVNDFDSYAYELLNSTGNAVIGGSISKNEKVYLGDISKGSYLLQISNQDFTKFQSEKIIIQ